VVAFNVDPLFNNAVDGLMYIRIADIPKHNETCYGRISGRTGRKLAEKRIKVFFR
jgi:hypothetical protein